MAGLAASQSLLVESGAGIRLRLSGVPLLSNEGSDLATDVFEMWRWENMLPTGRGCAQRWLDQVE